MNFCPIHMFNGRSIDALSLDLSQASGQIKTAPTAQAAASACGRKLFLSASNKAGLRSESLKLGKAALDLGGNGYFVRSLQTLTMTALVSPASQPK